MNKYGKRVKRKEEAPAKQPKVKNMLLQTYLTSLLCLVVCVVMFFGASYAWFSSEVNNAGNEIYVGTLKVGLYKESKITATDTDGTTETVAPLDLSNSENKLFGNSIRWEPGYTALETVQIVNEGDLAFKYVMTFTDGSLANAQASLKEVAKHFDVWVFSHRANNAAPNAQAYTEITEAAGWKPVGTLAEVLEGKVVLNGIMETVRDTDSTNDSAFDGVETGADTYTIALHMKEDTNSAAVAGQKISLNVKLVAYQLASETDGFGNNSYDSSVEVASDAAALKTLLADSTKNVVLASDLKLKTDERVTMSAPMLDGNGKTITYTGGRNADASVGVVTTSGGKIANLTITGGDNGRALYVTDLKSDLVVSNCTLSGAYAFNMIGTPNSNTIISFIDTTFSTSATYENVAKHVYFTDCTLGFVLKPCGDTTLTNCNIMSENLDVSELVAGETVTLINCTYKGQQIARAVLTAKTDGTVEIVDSTEIQLNDEKTVVLANG